MNIEPQILSKAQAWLNSSIDDADKNIILDLMSNNPNELIESFYTDLDFGTGGLRGIMGIGTNRINKYTIGIATQGLANYLKKQFGSSEISVAIAHDSRNNSDLFTQTAASVLSANGIQVHVFSALRPTPLLSYAVRELKCQSGIVITASHNPKEYNGYKVYWEDGGQVVAPHDKAIITEVRAISALDQVNFNKRAELIHVISNELEEGYIHRVKTLIRNEDDIKNAGLKIVYTSIHGAGITMVPKTLQAVGFHDVHIVESQQEPDGNFSTVESPNPEEKEALKTALELANELNADIVLGTDPDTDRVGLAVRNNRGELVLLNGNQTGSLLAHYQLSFAQQKGLLTGDKFIAKTIVTTELISRIARHFNVPCYDTLTGFKFIADVIRKKEGREHFISGGEESYGYLVGDFVRDKDGIISSVVIAEIAAWAKQNKGGIWNYLMNIYEEFGLFHEQLISITKKGMNGLKEIESMMSTMRQNPPAQLGNSKVTKVFDYKISECRDLTTAVVSAIDLPSSNVLQFELEDGSRITGRPSGTEPKIKFYFSIRESFNGAALYDSQIAEIEARMLQIRSELGI